MRLYLSGNSKLNVGYTPDTLIIDLKNKNYVFDISGWTDYDPNTLSTRTKGDLEKYNNRTKDYVPINKKDYDRLFKILNNPEARIAISIYPVDESQYKDASNDVLTDTTGMLCYENKEVHFKFYTEFYGI